MIEAFRPLMLEIGKDVIVENLPGRAFDVRVNVLDSTKLQMDTGWKPLVSFNEGVNITCDWLMKQ